MLREVEVRLAEVGPGHHDEDSETETEDDDLSIDGGIAGLRSRADSIISAEPEELFCLVVDMPEDEGDDR